MSNTTDKIFIVEIADDKFHKKYFPFNAFTWGVTLDNNYSFFSSPDYELENIGLVNVDPIISISVKQTHYQRVLNQSDVILFDGTWYFENNLLLIHFQDNKTPYHFTSTEIKIGFAIGLYNSQKNISGIFNGVQYYPRLKENPFITDTKDDIFNGRQIYNNLSISFENGDMKFKNFNVGYNVNKKNGNLVRLLSWTGEDSSLADYNDFILDYQGVIEGTKEGETIELSLTDLRTTLKEKSPNNTLNNANFPFIREGTYIKPHVWGESIQIPCICLNEEVNKDIDVITNPGTATNYKFMICDISKRTIDINSIQNIYINNELKNITTLNNVEYDNTNNIAYFTLSESDFRKISTNDAGSVTRIDWENQSKVSIDCYGYLNDSNLRIDNGLEVMRAIILDTYNKPFIDTFFDTAIWSSFEANAYDVQYYLDKPISIQEQLEELQASQLGKFIYNENIKFSFDNDDFAGTLFDIPKTQFFPEDYRLTIESDPSQVLNTYRVGYNRRWAVDDNELQNTWYKDISNSENAVDKYNSFVEKDYPTLLTNLTDVQNFGTRLLFEAGNSKDIFNITTLWDYRHLKAGEWVKVQADLINENYLGWTICQIQSVTPKKDIWLTELKLRVMQFITLWGTEEDNIISNENRQKLYFIR